MINGDCIKVLQTQRVLSWKHHRWHRYTSKTPLKYERKDAFGLLARVGQNELMPIYHNMVSRLPLQRVSTLSIGLLDCKLDCWPYFETKCFSELRSRERLKPGLHANGNAKQESSGRSKRLRTTTLKTTTITANTNETNNEIATTTTMSTTSARADSTRKQTLWHLCHVPGRSVMRQNENETERGRFRY